MLIVIHENSEPLNTYFIISFNVPIISTIFKNLYVWNIMRQKTQNFTDSFFFNFFKNKLKLTMFCTVFRFHSLRNCVRLWSFQLTEFLKNLFSEFTVIVELGRYMYLNVVSQKMSYADIKKVFTRVLLFLISTRFNNTRTYLEQKCPINFELL